ncbi:hypothetical protein CTAYLR_000706 [Chrysophaeum taylorii]|uniref:Uncharacterized protein n=1 Tax=Chrysophaeum taylorii TaxID=2483200 RepID=A0AAD7U9K0_9STRA|nr:hypothetical protein CTAYLR_000706 [Chrysophaeum taylorii]
MEENPRVARQIANRLSRAQVEAAVRALRAVEKKSNTLDLGAESYVVQVGLKKTSGAKRTEKPHVVELPHPIKREAACLLVKDVDKPWIKALVVEGEGAGARLEMPKLDGTRSARMARRSAPSREKGESPVSTPRIAKVISLQKLRTSYARYGERRTLRDAYDVFFADERILPMLTRALGKTFFSRKKQPIPVNVLRDSLPNQIEKKLGGAHLVLRPGNCAACVVATTDMPVDDVVDNVVEATGALVKDYIPKKWTNVLHVHLKLPSSASLPIWSSRVPVERGGDDDDDSEWPALVTHEEAEEGSKRKKRRVGDGAVPTKKRDTPQEEDSASKKVKKKKRLAEERRDAPQEEDSASKKKKKEKRLTEERRVPTKKRDTPQEEDSASDSEAKKKKKKVTEPKKTAHKTLSLKQKLKAQRRDQAPVATGRELIAAAQRHRSNEAVRAVRALLPGGGDALIEALRRESVDREWNVDALKRHLTTRSPEADLLAEVFEASLETKVREARAALVESRRELDESLAKPRPPRLETASPPRPSEKALLASIARIERRIDALEPQMASLVAAATEPAAEKRLNFRGRGLRDAQLQALDLRGVAVLDVSRNNISDKGVEALRGCDLRDLNLRSNSVGPDGAAVLARLVVAAPLLRLDVSENPIGPKGLAALAGALATDPPLTFLALDVVGDLTFLTEALYHNTHLKRLSLSGVHNGRFIIDKAHPRLHVEEDHSPPVGKNPTRLDALRRRFDRIEAGLGHKSRSTNNK